MITLQDVFAAALAAFAVSNLWFRPESFLRERRARTESWKPGLARKLLSCPFCLSSWPGPLMVLAIAGMAEAAIVVYALAAMGATHLLMQASGHIAKMNELKNEGDDIGSDSTE